MPESQRILWPQLGVLKDLGFVLHGGTAIALRIGHRFSVDFDFFSHLPLDKSAILKAVPILDLPDCELTQDFENTWSFAIPIKETGKSVKLSFFGTIDFGRVGTPQLTDDNKVMVASLDDLMAQKLKTVNQRVEVKDYLDIADMIQNGVDLYKGLRTARKLFGNSFQPTITLDTLTWFDGLNMAIFPKEKQKILVEAARKKTFDIQEKPVLLNSHYLTTDDIAKKLNPVLQREYNLAKLNVANKTIFTELIRLIPKQLSSNEVFQVRLLEDLLNKQDKGIVMQMPDPQEVAQEFATFEVNSIKSYSR